MVTHRLLLVEDDFDVAEMLLLYFESMDYEVLHADTGKEGIEIARTKFPHLILLDVMLPDMNGYDICFKLRQMALTKHIPTLFLTQKDERASRVKGLELGADDYITKPFDIDELRLRVEGAIRRATRENLHEGRTGLPTGPLVDEERQKRDNPSELRFTLHGFDAYVDVYSFMAANDVLQHAGKVIRDVLSEKGRDNDFVGMEDDEFVVLTSLKERALDELENSITTRFNEQVSTFYSFADADRGGIMLDEGDDNERFVPMMSLTTGDPQPVTDTPRDTDSSALDW
jgi:DNA-binding response OmpR family regulator